jgi:hypothetical protein
MGDVPVCECYGEEYPKQSCQLCVGTGIPFWTIHLPETEGDYWWRPDPDLVRSGALTLWGHAEDKFGPMLCTVFFDHQSKALMVHGGYFDYVPPYPLEVVGHTGYWAMAEPPLWPVPSGQRGQAK